MPAASAEFILHSRYDPVKEAVRFVDAQSFSYIPAYIVVSEPGESYLAPVFRQRYPHAKLIALRYESFLFADSDGKWDFVWRSDSGSAISDFLFNLIPDEYLPLTFFLSWKPSDAYWPDAAHRVWEEISRFIKLQTSIMHTRSHFGRKWLANMIKNTILSKSIQYSEKTEKPVFLASAGPSLEKQFPIKKDSFYVCTVSAALSCLRSNDCEPDVCVSTDGGYWALDHLRNIGKTTVLAFPLEASVPPAVLEQNPLVILDFDGCLEKKLLSIMGIEGEPAFRNGTVSGTASLYALSRTSGPVYAGGLDLRNTASFSHARPHASDIPNAVSSDRFHTLSTILFERNLESASLDMYAAWFSSRDRSFKNRFFRLLPEGKKITGIQCVPLPDLQHTRLDRKPEKKIQSVNSREYRVRKIADLLEVMVSELSEYLEPDLFEGIRDRFVSKIMQNQIYTEILQLVSFTDYILLLKKLNTVAVSDETAEAVCGICRSAIGFIKKIRTKAFFNE